MKQKYYPQSEDIMKHTKWANKLNTGCSVYMETTSTQSKEHDNLVSDKANMLTTIHV